MMARRGGARTPNEQTTPFVPPSQILEDSGSSAGPSPSSMFESLNLGRGGAGAGRGRRREDVGPPAGYPPQGYPHTGYPPPGFPPHGYPPPHSSFPPPHPYYPTPPTGFTPFPPGHFPPYGPYPGPGPGPGMGGYPPEAGGGGRGRGEGRGRGGGRAERDPRGPPPPHAGPFSHPMPYGGFSPYGPGYPYPPPPGPYGVSPFPGMPPIPGGHGMFPDSEFDAPPRSIVRPPSLSEMELDKWTPGSSYGPVLSPFQLSLLGISLEINPLLMPFTESSPPNQAHIEYNVLFPPNFAHRSDDGPGVSWARGRNEPATLPRISELRLISKKYPWVIDIEASKPDEGVTCIEVVQALHRDATLNVKAKIYNGLPNRSKAMVSKQYNHNRSTSRHAPGGAFDSGLKRGDFMLEFVMFNGLVNDQALIAERFKVAGPGWNGLKGRDPTKRQTYPATLVFYLDNVLMSDAVSILNAMPESSTDTETTSETETGG